MVDMENELLPRFTNPIMTEAIRFIDNRIKQNKILIHCNLGQSRAPSIALIYLANKRVIKNGTFNEAFHDFIELYKDYQPGKGIGLYINRNWTTLMDL
jgi:protein-tyrosine phosphatase